MTPVSIGGCLTLSEAGTPLTIFIGVNALSLWISRLRCRTIDIYSDQRRAAKERLVAH